MNWIDFFDAIYVINLLKRQDRLLDITQHLEEYEIPFKRWSAVEKPNGAEGLRDTMIQIFNHSVENDYQNILVFEDDALFVEQPLTVHNTMNEVVKQIPENYLLCFLGGQPTGGYNSFYSPNLLPVHKYFSTHSVMYSRAVINEILGRGLGFPIDNWYVDEIETLGNCYATNPLLCTQRSGFSDIGKSEINWNLFIEPKHRQELAKLHSK